MSTAAVGLAVTLGGLFVGAPSASAVGNTYRNYSAGLCLDTDGSGWGNIAVQRGCNPNRLSQRWAFIPVGGGYYKFVNDHNLCLGTQGGSTAKGAMVIQWECNGNDDQKWKPENVDSVSFKFRNKSGLCLGIWGGNTAPGAQAIMWDCNGNGDQRWAW
ncbi:RICIN domain-containing protein [Streptomyces sp. NPDC055721]|uniref:RICIN domain-containing protein n=1 Tax=Streptomyces sp. NPDC127132 TaxID=3345374 RepID=UPI0036408DE2